MSILVVGAGELGTATLESLSRHPLRKGAKVAVLLRQETIDSQDPAKRAGVAHLRGLGLDIEAGDFVKDPSALIPIFKKYHTVVQCAGYGMPPSVQMGVTKAVLEAEVPRYFPWQFGVDYEKIGKGSFQPQFDEMLDIRALLRAQKNTSWTIVSTGLFMSYLFLADFGVVDLENRTVRALGSWDNRVTVTTPRDIGIMVAEAAFMPDGTTDRVVYIGGETISYGQLADLLDETLEAKFKREEWALEALKSKAREDPENLWAKYQNIFGKGVGISWDQESTLNYQRGIPLTTIRTYILETVATRWSEMNGTEQRGK